MGNRRRLICALLLSSSALIFPVAPAHADPVSIGVAIASAAFAATGITTAGLLTFTWTTFAFNAALGLTALALGSGAGKRGPSLGDRTTNVRQPISPIKTIYGRQKVGGTLIFAENTNGGDGTKNEHLHLVFALAYHEIDAIEEIYVGKKKVTFDNDGFVQEKPYRERRVCRIRYNLGTANQTAFSELVAESDGKWTTEHRGRGVPLLYVRLRKDTGAWSSGIPKFSAVVRGKRIRNLRTGVTEWSDNSVYCTADYLLTLGEKLGRIDTDNFRAQGAICDELVSRRRGDKAKRYTCNGVVSDDEKTQTVLQNFLTSSAGDLFWTGGKWQILAGAWQPPVVTLTEDDLRSGMKIVTRHSRADNFNGVKGAFTGAETNWAPDSYPAVRSRAFVEADGGRESLGTIDLPFTSDSAEAQRIARIALYAQREQLSVTAEFGLRAARCGAGDTVRLHIPRRLGWEYKTFKVQRWVFKHSADGDIAIELTLREISPWVYYTAPDEELFERNNTKLPDPLDVDPPLLQLDSELREINQSVMTIITANVTSNEGTDVGQFELQYKLASSSKWLSMGKQTSNVFEIIVRSNQIYDIRARYINTFRVSSDWTVRKDYVADAIKDPPANVDLFDLTVTAGVCYFTWAPVPDLDLSHYVIRWSPDISGVTWANTSVVAAKVSRPATSISLPARNGTYLIRAVDKTGRMSVTPAEVITTMVGVENANVIDTVVESPVFSGAKSTTAVDMTLPAGLVITQPVVQTVPARGIYYFNREVDLGAKYLCSFRASIKMQRFEYNGRLFDSVSGEFDAQPGMFENPDTSDLDVRVDIRYRSVATDDWSRWQELTRGDFEGRYFQFRAVLESETIDVSPKVTALSVTVDMPDRTESDNDVTSVASGSAILFTLPFHSLRGIGITASDMNSGDYYRVTNKSRDGFTIRFYNAAGTGIVRQFDWIARGYGKKR